MKKVEIILDIMLIAIAVYYIKVNGMDTQQDMLIGGILSIVAIGQTLNTMFRR